VQESVKVGDKFPVSELVASDGQRLDLASLAGPAVVYFYPADGTETCTLQAVEFNRALGDFTSAGVALVGVSVDDDESHRCFARDEGLGFPLVSDAGGELTERLGLTKDYGEYGKLAGRVALLLETLAAARALGEG
jgi:thioredoxin-dependent peroxiredoxin